MAVPQRLPNDLTRVSVEKSINRVIGYGATFPFNFNSTGAVHSVDVSTGLAKINQSIHMVLSTRKGERVMRPTFGSNLPYLVFEPNDDTTWEQLKFEVADALAAWEKRIRITNVSSVAGYALSPTFLTSIPGLSQESFAELQDPNTIGIVIQYIVLRTNVKGSYVFPFALQGQPLDSNLGLRIS